MRYVFTLFSLVPVMLFAQLAGDVPVPQGVIKVRKPSVRPYFKVEYYLSLARVTEVEVLVPAANGIPGVMERDKVPVFDSSLYGPKFERVYPVKSVLLSKMLVDQIDFSYAFGDTARIDTMLVEMWIGKNGKIKWRSPDTTHNGSMPRALEVELYNAFSLMTDWGMGGGYMEPKRFLRKQRKMAENYYCALYVISSAHPLTTQQRSTGSRYAPFDIPLNSPPDNEQQRDFIEGNKRNDQNKENVN